MSSEQIRVSVDSDLWKEWKRAGEKNTAAMQRLLDLGLLVKRNVDAPTGDPRDALIQLLTSNAVNSVASKVAEPATVSQPKVKSPSPVEPVEDMTEAVDNGSAW